MHQTNASAAPLVTISRAGEVVLSVPSFWDMCISFLQLSAVIWLSILVLYGCSRLLLLWHRWQRKMAMRKIVTLPYQLQWSFTIPFSVGKIGNVQSVSKTSKREIR